MEIAVHQENELPKAVEALLAFAQNKKKFALTGDLGAGKTTFVQAFCRHFNVREKVTSPTYSLVNEYTFLEENGQEQLIHHLDLYRLETLEEAQEIGIEEYLYDEYYCLIEWPGLIAGLLPENVVHVKIAVQPDGRRLFGFGF
ncbi:MAG: tRNA (adenosine(37)-N6)-threonylcarbamoyltransferase complex ATPase subunit type 1 TsaE [Lewinellaceae bacterium]|nr:tRNA (adenosine(37)-N6)-threonylcarbamoyltransferase complex ATPase subunit type 1 TsaE [Lewinellaceae bacterium]